MIVQSLSISAPLLEYQNSSHSHWHVHSVFNSVVYINNAEGDELFALVHRHLGNGPFYILLPDDAPLNLLAAGMPVRFSEKHLLAGPLEIDLDTAQWQPELADDELLNAGDYKSKEFKEILIQSIEQQRASRYSSGIEQVINLRLNEYAEAMVDVIIRNKLDALPSIAAGLAGLGKGLTPAGDDLILGFCFGLWLARRWAAISLIIAAAMPKTNLISRAFLRAASQRRFTESWHNLLHAMTARDRARFQAAIQRISRFGASSGIDSLTGFLYATLLMDAPRP